MDENKESNDDEEDDETENEVENDDEGDRQGRERRNGGARRHGGSRQGTEDSKYDADCRHGLGYSELWETEQYCIRLDIWNRTRKIF